MTWFKTDDGLAFHPKAIAAGNQAMGLWVRAGSWCSQQRTNGRVPDSIVAALGGSEADVKRLVDARLWHARADECEVCEGQGFMPIEDGYQFHDWLSANPSRADLEAEAEARGRSGREGNHRRWHERRRVVDPECEFCQASQDRSGKRSGNRSSRGNRTTDRARESGSGRKPDRTTESVADRKTDPYAGIPPTRPDPTRPDPSTGEPPY